MEKLRTQLDDIEKCAHEAATSSVGMVRESADQSGDESEGGATALPVGMTTSSMIEKQRIIIEELRKRFDFEFGDLEQLR